MGDTVAWGTTYGRSPALCIAKIEKIRYFTRHGKDYGPTKECDRAIAEGYNLVLRPLKSTGDISWTDLRPNDPRPSGSQYWPQQQDVDAEPDRYESKLKTIQHVKNVVKLDA